MLVVRGSSVEASSLYARLKHHATPPHSGAVGCGRRAVPAALGAGSRTAGLPHKPLHANAVTLTWSFYDGGLNFNGAIPITGATGTYNVPVFSYYHSLNFFGRSA